MWSFLNRQRGALKTTEEISKHIQSKFRMNLLNLFSELMFGIIIGCKINVLMELTIEFVTNKVTNSRQYFVTKDMRWSSAILLKYFKKQTRDSRFFYNSGLTF